VERTLLSAAFDFAFDLDLGERRNSETDGVARSPFSSHTAAGRLNLSIHHDNSAIERTIVPLKLKSLRDWQPSVSLLESVS
jgi:hypothetical protein